MKPDFKTNLYNFISDYIAEHHDSPSFYEMTEAMGISPRSKSLITRSLKSLENEGQVELRKAGRRLLISLFSRQLPLLGKISAGAPIEAIADRQLIDPNALLFGENHFALKVKGDSMIEEGILDGDLIICRQNNVAREGEIVVALIDHTSATLKKISYKIKGVITLIPANAQLKPRAYAPDRIQIQGIYIGLLRIKDRK